MNARVDDPDPTGFVEPLTKGAHLLVVDDDPSNLRAIGVVLAPLGVCVTTARSGQDALRALLTREFALILLDVRMPTMDGFETARLIRTRRRLDEVPIIFVTAHLSGQADALRGYDLGAVDYLEKPIVPEVLRAKVRVLVELRERTREVRQQAEQLRENERRESARALEEERRRWEEELLRREMAEQRDVNARLAEMDRRKDDFLAVLAHELRNPLAPLVLNLERIREVTAPDPVAASAREAMERQVRHLTRLVDDLLDVSRITRGKLELAREPVDLASVVHHALELSGPSLAAHVVEVEPAMERCLVLGDAVRLTQVLANLLNNAAQCSEAGTQIAVRWGPGPGGLHELTVRDHGRGIAPEFLACMFDLFAQERGGRGLGIGLTLAKELVEKLGGTLEAQSDGLGCGATMVVRLPRFVPDVAWVEQVTQRTPRLSPSDASPLRVAIVEDDDDIREAFGALVGSWGHHVTTASDGARGIELISRDPLDVAFVDLGLPDLDGYEVARQVVEALGPRRPRLVALSGFGQTADRERARASGFDLHLVKPSSPDELRDALEGTSSARERNAL